MIPLEVLYNRLPSPSLGAWVESVELVERRDGKASTLTVALCNADGRFLGPWRATKGDSLSLSRPPSAPDVYAIKKISVRRSPAVVTWEAEGRPATTKAPSGRGRGTPPPDGGALVEDKKSWEAAAENIRLRDLAERVCSECGLVLKYVARKNPTIKYVARYNETGFHLLDRYCRMFALTLRATSGSVTILAVQSREDKSPPKSVALAMNGVEELAESQDMAARSVRSARLDPRSAQPVRFSAGDGDGTDIDVRYDAQAAADIYAASVAAARVAVVDIVPRADIVAGSVVDIQGLGLREVVEMRYTRTGDAERMSLTVRSM